METSKRVQIFSVIAAVLFVMVAMTAGYRRIGVPPVVIVGDRKSTRLNSSH